LGYGRNCNGWTIPRSSEDNIFFNCILARSGTPVFVPKTAKTADRTLTVIGDIACDPDSDFSPIKVYDRTTTWDKPALRVADEPPLDVTAIDNLPSMLPAESSQDFAEQLLPSLLKLSDMTADVWGRANDTFLEHTKAL
jgi:saccharopine dehydrogenase (NAD+, L-lysine-forming)